MRKQESKKPGTIKMLLGCRICWKVTLAAFLAILIVEAIVLIPSYRNYAIDWQKNRSSEALSAVKATISFAEDSAHSPLSLTTSIGRIAKTAQILGWRILPNNGNDVIQEAGDLPVIDNSKSLLRKFWSEFIYYDFMDTTWTSEALSIPFRIQVRLNTDDLRPALKAFVGRIVGLVAIISLFVTTVIMFVLRSIILSPVLEIRGRLTEAGNDVEHSESYRLNIQRNDEIGDVIDSFNNMLLNTSDNLSTIRHNEEALKQAHDSLEIKVRERTAELIDEIEERHQIERKLLRSEQHLFNLANYDDLTGLPNRLLAMDRLNLGLQHSSRKSCTGALMFIDLDNFKDINDTLGHAKGDELLKQVATRLAEVLRDTDSLVHMSLGEGSIDTGDRREMSDIDKIVARIGGDEFMVILPEIASPDDAAVVAARIRDACIEPFKLHDNEVFVSASIGIAIFPRDGVDPEELMICADTALYATKEEGRNNYHFFSPEMNHLSAERIKIERHLRHALVNNELEVHYQPVINLETQDIIGVEALLRWNSPMLGSISPDQFIPVAESSGIILSIGEWVLQEACRSAETLAKSGYPLRMAVNVSARQFRDANFAEIVKKTLHQHHISPQHLELEITESLLVDKNSKAMQVIKELRNLGVRFAIDDFGTGYSAIGYLRQFSVDTLKIDRSFIAGVCTDQQDASLTRTIVGMAKNFGLEIIAEGVEDKNQLAFLREIECDQAQGYLFGKPMPFEDLLDTMSR